MAEGRRSKVRAAEENAGNADSLAGPPGAFPRTPPPGVIHDDNNPLSESLSFTARMLEDLLTSSGFIDKIAEKVIARSDKGKKKFDVFVDSGPSNINIETDSLSPPLKNPHPPSPPASAIENEMPKHFLAAGLSKVPEYRGELSNNLTAIQKLRAFTEKIEVLIYPHLTNPSHQVHFARYHLAGKAADEVTREIKRDPSSIHDWPTLKKFLEKKFLPFDAKSRTLESLVSSKAHNGESMEKWVERFNRLRDQVGHYSVKILN